MNTYTFSPSGNNIQVTQTDDAGKSTVIGTGNADYAKGYGYTAPAPAAGTVPNIPTQPPIVSSKDMSGSFADSSASLAGKKPADTYTTANGAIVDSTGKIITPAPTGTDANKTAIEKNAAGAGEDKSKFATGDPLYDNLQTWEKEQEAKNNADAEEKKLQAESLLKTNLAANDAMYAAQINGIKNTYSQLIDVQTRINNLNTSRVKAYGLSSGNAMSTPIEFTHAVTDEENKGISAIGKLDNSRDALIAQAEAAQQAGDAKLLADKMASIDVIEKNMRDQATALQNSVDNRYQMLQGIEKDQKAQLQETQKSLLAAAVTNYGQEYSDETDNKKKDALIKKIIGDSGGLLDYGGVLASLSANSKALADAKTQGKKDAADLALKAAQTASANSTAAKNFKEAAATGKTSVGAQNIINGVTSLEDIDDKDMEAVKADLQKFNMYDDKAPDWYVKMTNDQTGQTVMPDVVQEQWDAFRVKAGTKT